MKTMSLVFLLMTFGLFEALAQENIGAGNAIKLDGVDDHILIPDNDLLDLTNIYTLEAWIKLDAYSWLGGIISKYQTDGSNGYTLRLSVDAPFHSINFDGMTTTDILELGKWYHISAVNDNGERRLYINGKSIKLNGSPDFKFAAVNTDPVKVGSDFNSRYLNGTIDEVRIWKIAMTESEISSNMFKVLKGDEAGLVGLWQLNETSGLDVLNSIKAGPNGTLKGGSSHVTSFSNTQLLAFSVIGEFQTSIDPINHTIDIMVFKDKDVAALVSTFALPLGTKASINGAPQVSGKSINNFTKPVIYKITSEDGLSSQDWLVSVVSVKSVDGVAIKDQIWSSKNLDVSHFRNGDEIPIAAGFGGFVKAYLDRSPCYIQDGQWGKLYNYWAVNDPRGLAPTGWHIPTKEEWGLLMNNLGGNHDFSKKGINNGLVSLLKSQEGWAHDNGNDLIGFSAFPAGTVNPNGIDRGRGIVTYWWTSSMWNHENFWYVGLGDAFEKNSILSLYMDAGYGCSVRVVKGEWGRPVDYKLPNYDAPTSHMAIENAIDKDNLVLKNGVYFQNGSEIPYSGVIKGKVMDNNSNVFTLLLFQNFKNGKANGDSTTWYSWHRKKYVASYINGKKEGLESMWDFNGNKMYEVNNKNGKHEGSYIVWSENGYQEWNYTGGVVLGSYSRWWDTGKKREEANYENGLLEGSWLSWHSNGQKAEEGSYVKGRKNGLWSRWYENGMKRYEGLFEAESVGMQVMGKNVQEWFDNGQKKFKVIQNEGKLITTYYHANGQINNVNTSINGKDEGLLTIFNEAGIKTHEYDRVHGVTKRVTEFYDTGQKKSEAIYGNGQPKTRKDWDEKGKLTNNWKSQN